MDFLTADNSLAGEVTPGHVGANVVTNTLLPWILARTAGVVPVPEIDIAGEEEVSPANYAPLIGGIVGGIVVIGLLVLFVIKKRARQL